MENLTIKAEFNADCADGCGPDEAQIAAFRRAVRLISGKWKIEILAALMDGPVRFGALRRALPGVTQHMLTAQLRELERGGLVRRTAYPQVPPRVDYELSEAGYGLLPAFRALRDWSGRHGAAGSAS